MRTIKLPLSKSLAKKLPKLGKVRLLVVEVTPQLAEEWLALNTNNRTFRKKQIAYLSQSLSSEGGIFSTDCIAFRDDGTVLNGQHRLKAIVETGISIPCLVLWGLPDATDTIEDHVAPRQARDLVKTKSPNIKNVNDKVTIPATYWRLKDMRSDSSWTAARWSHDVYTKNFIANYVIENNKKLSWALSLVHNVNADLIFAPRGVYAAAALILAERHKGATEAFFHRVSTGEGLAAGDPLLWLRNYLLRQQQDKTTKGTEATDPIQVKLALLFMAWNAWIEGKSFKKAPRIYVKDKNTGMTTTVPWPVPKRPGGEYQPWLVG